MKTNYLFPHRFKKIGWVLFVPFAALSIYYMVQVTTNIIPGMRKTFGPVESFLHLSDSAIGAIILSVLTISLLFIAFSREKTEDEYIAKVRGDSLVWATLVSYFVTIIAIICLYEMGFFYFMCLNIYLLLVLFVIKFNIALYKLRKSGGHEE